MPVTEWKEAKAPRNPGQIWDFRRGYRVTEVGRHENEKEFAAFQHYLHSRGERDLGFVSELTNVKLSTIKTWHRKYNWQRRAAAYDVKETSIVWKQADQMQRNEHREAIIQFRETSEKQARMMARVSEDLLRVLGKRIEQAELNDEQIPINQVGNLLKAAASVSEQSRQSWATALGVNEMLEMVETEINSVDVEVVDLEEDPYDIPIEE